MSTPVPPDSVASRRSSILAAATGEMARCRMRRVRRARIATVMAVVGLGATVAIVLQRAAPESTEHRALAREYAIDFEVAGATAAVIDFAVVGSTASTSGFALNFSIVESTDAPVLDTLTDAEAEQALADTGYCVRIFRVQDNPMLVDCTTGGRAVIGLPSAIGR